MSSKRASAADIVRPIKQTGRWYKAGFALASLVALGWMAIWGYQLENGLVVTNLADWGSGGGTTWGVYIGAFIWWVGIAHGGIIISAAVRLFGMDRYLPVARIAELLTIAGLSMAGTYILVHMGRPDRVVLSVIPSFPWTVQSSPLAWDITVITLYFVLTATYLALTVRYDVARLRDDLPDALGPLYSIITLGYTKREDEVIERMVWWLALGIIVLAPLLLHGGVIPWLFALLPSMPGWQGAIQGPQFLSIALTSAIAGVIVISYILRWAYDWDHILTDDVFRGLTLWLGLFGLLFLWLQLQQVITGVYAAPLDVRKVSFAKITNPVYIFAIGTMVLVMAYIFAQAVRESVFGLRRSLAVSLMALVATLSEKVLFVVEGIEYATFNLYEAVPGHYMPSFVELSSIAGTVALATLFFMVVLKVVPVVELHAVEDHDEEHDPGGGEVEHDSDRESGDEPGVPA
jgi:molybdopterin-containing oxidoreductase family membrane subunit